MSLQTSTITHIDLFSGVGGICTGFKSVGIQTVVAVEHVDSCVDTYLANHPEVSVFLRDIREVSSEEIQKEMHRRNLTSVDIVSAGFPCETFSTAGSKSRVYGDHRNYLYQEAIRLADAANAKILLFENVPAFTSKRINKNSKRLIFDDLVKDLKNHGYKYWDYDILNTANYGVPQKRERFILIASKTIPITKEQFNFTSSDTRVNVEEAFSDLPPIEHSSESVVYHSHPLNCYQKRQRSTHFWKPSIETQENYLSYHITTKHRPNTIERFKLIHHGEGLKDLFDKLSEEERLSLQEKKILPKKWYIQRNYRLIPKSQSKTVTSHCVEELLHPFLNRSLSVREVARLQSFPDYYDFKGGPLICPHIYHTQDKYEQIGDAVPPLLARHLGACARELLGK